MTKSPNKSSKDQRISKRVPLKIKVDWKCEGTFLFENATNISEHGIFIETTEVMSPGTVLELQFALPETSIQIKTKGEVIWVNPVREDVEGHYRPGMGIRFVSLRDVDRDTILSLIKRIAVLSGPT